MHFSTLSQSSTIRNFYFFLPNKKDTTAMTITAPMTEGINAIPAKLGPQVPKIACPTEEPIKPAIIPAIIPIDPAFLVILPAINPINPPIIHD